MQIPRGGAHHVAPGGNRPEFEPQVVRESLRAVAREARLTGRIPLLVSLDRLDEGDERVLFNATGPITIDLPLLHTTLLFGMGWEGGHIHEFMFGQDSLAAVCYHPCFDLVRGESAAGESDTESDYGVVWLQSNVRAKNGWCTKRAASDVLLPEIVAVPLFSALIFGAAAVSTVVGIRMNRGIRGPSRFGGAGCAHVRVRPGPAVPAARGVLRALRHRLRDVDARGGDVEARVPVGRDHPPAIADLLDAEEARRLQRS